MEFWNNFFLSARVVPAQRLTHGVFFVLLASFIEFASANVVQLSFRWNLKLLRFFK